MALPSQNKKEPKDLSYAGYNYSASSSLSFTTLKIPYRQALCR